MHSAHRNGDRQTDRDRQRPTETDRDSASKRQRETSSSSSWNSWDDNNTIMTTGYSSNDYGGKAVADKNFREYKVRVSESSHHDNRRSRSTKNRPSDDSNTYPSIINSSQCNGLILMSIFNRIIHYAIHTPTATTAHTTTNTHPQQHTSPPTHTNTHHQHTNTHQHTHTTPPTHTHNNGNIDTDIPQADRQTDRQTDRRTDRQRHIRTLSFTRWFAASSRSSFLAVFRPISTLTHCPVMLMHMLLRPINRPTYLMPV
jgi:hypothetical protein